MCYLFCAHKLELPNYGLNSGSGGGIWENKQYHLDSGLMLKSGFSLLKKLQGRIHWETTMKSKGAYERWFILFKEREENNKQITSEVRKTKDFSRKSPPRYIKSFKELKNILEMETTISNKGEAWTYCLEKKCCLDTFA